MSHVPLLVILGIFVKRVLNHVPKNRLFTNVSGNTSK